MSNQTQSATSNKKTTNVAEQSADQAGRILFTFPGTKVKVDFGAGRYSAVMAEACGDAHRLTDMDAETCEAFARQLGSYLGRATAGKPVTVTYGKTTKDGKLTLKEACNIKGVTETKSMTLGRLLSKLNELAKLAQIGQVDFEGSFPVTHWSATPTVVKTEEAEEAETVAS